MEFVVIWFLFGIFSAIVANSKGRSGCGWALLGFLFGPFGLLVAFMPKVEAEIPPRPTKTCPFCAESILSDARVCRYCGRDLPEEDQEF